MDSANWGTLIVSAITDIYFSPSFEQGINDKLKGSAVGRHNQTDVYLAIVKRSGNENQPFKHLSAKIKSDV